MARPSFLMAVGLPGATALAAGASQAAACDLAQGCRVQVAQPAPPAGYGYRTGVPGPKDRRVQVSSDQ